MASRATITGQEAIDRLAIREDGDSFFAARRLMVDWTETWPSAP